RNRHPPRSPLFPYTTLFRSFFNTQEEVNIPAPLAGELGPYLAARPEYDQKRKALLEEYKIPAVEKDWEDKLRYAQQHPTEHDDRSEEHTSELQSPYDLVCRL